MQGMGVMTGRRLANYELGAPLGEDGFGPLYEAFQLNLERTFALRVLSDRFTFSAGFEEHFDRVARVLSGLEHANLLTLDDFGIDGPYAYLVTPFVEGLTLDAWLRQRPGQPVGPAQFTRLVGQMLAGLNCAHQVGVTHLGLTPRHMLIQPNGHLLIANFGLPYLAEQLWIAWNGSRSFGDPVYLAPEQIPGRTPSGVAADLYALGVILYRLLTGVLPFEGPPQVVLSAKLEGPKPPRARYPALPVPLERLIMRALAPAPEDRWASVAEFGGAFYLALKQASEQLPGFSPVGGESGGLLSGSAAPPLLAAPGGNLATGSVSLPTALAAAGRAGPASHAPRPALGQHDQPPAGPPAPQTPPAKVLAWSSAGKGRVAPPPLPPPAWRQGPQAPAFNQQSFARRLFGTTARLLLLLVTLAVLGGAIFYGYHRWMQLQHQKPIPSPTAAPTQTPVPTTSGHRLGDTISYSWFFRL